MAAYCNAYTVNTGVADTSGHFESTSALCLPLTEHASSKNSIEAIHDLHYAMFRWKIDFSMRSNNNRGDSEMMLPSVSGGPAKTRNEDKTFGDEADWPGLRRRR
ncbi:uncharacterized protein AtWU_09007 [Aspergillus tubingensis]|uniref:uncharacterized protein n=1 Tax=Aspergillus tubingensis TaxID=5068 RepID=UPI001578ADC6|nr:uncharacterized protein AtWU_09007 [Aspergillus tubingensis]GFN19204.1 hypothetical protein AtWU_09007 [Aspergillus tubingensis]